MLNKNNWLKIILGAVIILVFGVVIGFLASKKLSDSFICSSNQSFLDEFQRKFQEKIANGALPPMTMSLGLMPTTSSLWGKIVKVDSNFLVMRVINSYRGGNFIDYVLNQPSFYEIKVNIDENTQIVKTLKVLPSSPEKMMAGIVFKEEKVAFSELKEEISIVVELANAIDIAEVREVVATKISVM